MLGAVQIALGVLFVSLVYGVIFISVLRFAGDQTRPIYFKTAVPILKGYTDISTISNRTWSTVDPRAEYYLPMTRSVNRKGGSQFSYSFWMKLNPSSGSKAFAHRIILIRGDANPYWIKQQQAGFGGSTRMIGPTQIVQCPGIAFGRSASEFVVTMNTSKGPLERFVIGERPPRFHEAPADRHQALGLVHRHWALHTFTFEDNVDISQFAKGMVVRFYINGSVYDTYRSSSKLQTNRGNLYLSPGQNRFRNGSGIIGDVTYHNYALTPEDVRSLFEAGPPKKPSRDNSIFGPGHESEPRYLSEYNKLDLIN